MEETKEKEQIVIDDNGNLVEESKLKSTEEVSEVMEEITEDTEEVEEYEEV